MLFQYLITVLVFGFVRGDGSFILVEDNSMNPLPFYDNF